MMKKRQKCQSIKHTKNNSDKDLIENDFYYERVQMRVKNFFTSHRENYLLVDDDER